MLISQIILSCGTLIAQDKKGGSKWQKLRTEIGVKVDYYWDFVEKSSAFISSLKLIYNVNKLGKWLS